MTGIAPDIHEYGVAMQYIHRRPSCENITINNDYRPMKIRAIRQ